VVRAGSGPGRSASRNGTGQVVHTHTHVPLFTKQYKLIRTRGQCVGWNTCLTTSFRRVRGIAASAMSEIGNNTLALIYYETEHMFVDISF